MRKLRLGLSPLIDVVPSNFKARPGFAKGLAFGSFWAKKHKESDALTNCDCLKIIP